jgi:flavin reductase (DIM6/NTAB) family NADH-FMN oxidoreductase RutF
LKDKFLEVLRTTKQNVFVLAAANGDQRHAMTVSSVFSVSLEPMSMAVSVNQSASLHDLLKVDSKFSLNLLTTNQVDIAEICSGSEEGQIRFNHPDWNLEEVPYLRSAQSNLFCTCRNIVPLYSHSLVIGEVDDLFHSGKMNPLIYQDGKYEIK